MYDLNSISSVDIQYSKNNQNINIEPFYTLQKQLKGYWFFHVSPLKNADTIIHYGLLTKKAYAGASNKQNIEDYIYWKNMYHGVYLASISRYQLITVIKMISEVFNTNELMVFGIQLNSSEIKSLLLDEDSIDIIITYYLLFFTLWFFKIYHISKYSNIIDNIQSMSFKEDWFKKLYSILNECISINDFLPKLAYYFNMHFRLGIKLQHLDELERVFEYYIIVKNIFENDTSDKSKYLNTILTFRDYWIKLLTILNPKISSSVIPKMIQLIDGPSTFTEDKKDFQHWKKIRSDKIFKYVVDELILRSKYNKEYDCSKLLKYWFKNEIKTKEDIDWLYYWLVVVSQRYIYLSNISHNKIQPISKIYIK